MKKKKIKGISQEYIKQRTTNIQTIEHDIHSHLKQSFSFSRNFYFCYPDLLILIQHLLLQIYKTDNHISNFSSFSLHFIFLHITFIISDLNSKFQILSPQNLMKYSIQQTEEGKNDFQQQSFGDLFLGLPLYDKDLQNPQKGINCPENSIQQNQKCENSQLKSGPQYQKRALKQKRGKRHVVEWSYEQDQLLFEKYFLEGSKWVQIADVFPTKTDNDVKNRFYCCIRRVHKKVNQFQLKAKVKPKKLISFDCILTYLQITKFNQNQLDGRFSQIKKRMESILEVRQLIFDMALKTEAEIDNEAVSLLVSKLVQIKYTLKFINIKRVKKSGQKGSQMVGGGGQAESMVTKEQNRQQSQFQHEQEQPCLKQRDDNKNNINNLDIERLQQELAIERFKKGRSVIQQCSGLLCPSLMEMQQSDQLCFMF